MKEQLPKSEWGTGPWQDEPDDVQWVDKATKLPCWIKRNMHVTGSLCGYVGVPSYHAAYKVDYDGERGDLKEGYRKKMRGWMKERAHSGKPISLDDINDMPERPPTLPLIGKLIRGIDVHGGLTFAAFWEGEKYWWFGFDCGHSSDLSPMMEATLAVIYAEDAGQELSTQEAIARRRMKDLLENSYRTHETYKTYPYVKEQVEHLALQLKAIKFKKRKVHRW
jgi:hypothetical protein